MAFTETISDSIYTPEGNLQAVRSQSCDMLIGISRAVSGGTEVTVNVGLVTADVKSLYAITTGNNVTVTFNGDGETVALVAGGQPVDWQASGYFAIPYTTNLTTLVINAAAGASAQVEMRIGVTIP